MITDRHPHQFHVDYAFDLLFGEDVFAPGNDTLLGVLRREGARPARCLVCIDDGILTAWPELERRIPRWFAAHAAAGVELAAAPERIAGGEAAKQGWCVVERIGHLCVEQGICRHSYIIAIGGGAVLDAVGLGAALVHRGVRLVRLPTTVLAQDDAGLGVKNGINAHGSKNFFGTFAPPWAIVNDRAFLPLLDDRAWRAGIAEAVKVALIKDAGFLRWILGSAPALAARHLDSMAEMIRRCALLHLDHITQGGDPFETGSSRPLDFGHWSAHRLEIDSRHRLSHGEAVVLGVALDLLYAVRISRIDAATVEAVLDALAIVGFALWDEALDLRDRHGRRSVLQGLDQFREHLGGELTLAMPNGLGQRQDIHELDPALFEACVQQLRRAARQRQTTQV